MKQPVEEEIKNCLVVTDYANAQQLDLLDRTLEWLLFSKNSGTLDVACLHYWQKFVSLVRSQTSRLNDQYMYGTVGELLHEMASKISPFDIEAVGKGLSQFISGSKGIDLLKECVFCILTKAELDSTSGRNTVEHAYAQAYLDFFDEVKGRGMRDLDNLNVIQHQYKKANPLIVANFVRSREKAYAERNTPFNANEIVSIVNSEVVEKLQGQKKDLRQHLFNDADINLSDPSELTNNLKDEIPYLLDVCAYNMLLNDLKSKFICELKPIPDAKHISLEDVTKSFDSFNINRNDQTAKNDFIKKATNYSAMRQQQIMTEANPSTS